MTERYVGVQLLRYVAAMLVALMHITQAISMHITGRGSDQYWEPGGAGVDIFFVISGFVMATATASVPRPGQTRVAAAWLFLKRRLLRIAPLYWFYTLLKAALLLALPTLAVQSSLDGGHLLASLLFLPARGPSGLLQPTLQVGWTLNFEMFFYVVFALAIGLGAPRARFCVLVFLAFFLASALFPAIDPLRFYAQTRVFEFVAGMLVALWVSRLRAVPPALSCALFTAGMVWLLLVDWAPGSDELLRSGLAATAIVLCTVALEPWFTRSRLAARLSFLGDASYSIYLSHALVVPAAVLSMRRLGVTDPVVIVLFTASVVTLVGCLSYTLLERPMTSIFKRVLFSPRREAVRNA
ncbi:MAG: acyltransferase [Ramlibacter sp.]|nr:acyltransferase [Ramlibacter sp.]